MTKVRLSNFELLSYSVKWRPLDTRDDWQVLLKAYSQATTLETPTSATQAVLRVNQNSLKHYPTLPTYTHHNRMALTLFRPPSPLQILIPPSEFTWLTSPASLRAEPSQRTSSALPHSNQVPKLPFGFNPLFPFESLVFHLNGLPPTLNSISPLSLPSSKPPSTLGQHKLCLVIPA